jgi:flagellar biosynthesis protein FliQ
VSPDQALALIDALLRTTVFIAGPILAAALAAGLLVGVVQTATQVNETSVSFVVKVGAVLLVFLTLGPLLAQHAVSYARDSFMAIEQVVH